MAVVLAEVAVVLWLTTGWLISPITAAVPQLAAPPFGGGEPIEILELLESELHLRTALAVPVLNCCKRTDGC
jgi:hypothetical protein